MKRKEYKMSEKNIEVNYHQINSKMKELFGDNFFDQSKEWLLQYNKLMAY